MKKKHHLYQEVRTQEIAPGKWQIFLDEKPIKTPAGNPVIVPTRGLADAIAGEWRSEGDKMRRERMGLARLANTAIDRVSENRALAVAELLKFAGGDLLCFRASGPTQLAERQSAVWDPLMEWAGKRYGISLETRCDIAPLTLRSGDVAALNSLLLQVDEFSLAGLVAAANILGSVILALALREGRVDAAQTLEAADLDSRYQAEIWGEDSELTSRNANRLKDVSVIAQFLGLTGAL
jgi:chaperone required for assembly of F1-ATPase